MILSILMGNYDITQKLYEGYRATQNFAEVLIETCWWILSKNNWIGGNIVCMVKRYL